MSSEGGFDGYLEHDNYLSSSLIGTMVPEYGIRSQILWHKISVTWRSPKMLEPDARFDKTIEYSYNPNSCF